MIDTHAHINTEKFDDLDEVIERAKDSGVEKIIIPAIEPDDYDDLIKKVETHSELYFGIGIHPHSADKFNQKTVEKIEEIADHEKCVAIGEIGLDYYYDSLPARDIQKNAFRKQLQIAKSKGLPVIIHNRDSDDDLLEILSEEKDNRLNGVMHCFPDNVELLKKSLDLGLNVSFTGNITFKKSKHEEVLKEVPLGRFMIETDSPYMAPVPYRGKRNEPAYVGKVAEKIAEVKNMSVENILENTTKTAKELFRLSLIAALFFTFSNYSFAQDDDEYYYEDSEYYEEEEVIEEHPYPKLIGIGGMIGTNTIVESQSYLDGTEASRSFDGLFSYGGTITYGGLFDFLIFEASYNYSVNNTVSELNEGVDPFTYSVYEFSTLWTPNPYNKINVFGTLGGSYIQSTFDEGDEKQNFGLNTGIGFILNVPVKGVGLFTLNAEWRITFLFGEEERLDFVNGDPQTIEFTSFFSIPRFGISYYPEF